MEFQVYDISIVPLIIALVAVATSLGLPIKIAPILAILLGIAVGTLYIAPDDILQGILVGVTLGLGAVGLYSTTKNIGGM